MMPTASTIHALVSDLRHLRGRAILSQEWAPVIAAEEALLAVAREAERAGEVKELPDGAGKWWMWWNSDPVGEWILTDVRMWARGDGFEDDFCWRCGDGGLFCSVTPGRWVRCLPPAQ